MENLTGKMINAGGVPMFTPNTIFIDKSNDYYVSYNNRDIGIYGSDTTALVHDSRFYILDGNHTDAYSKFESIEECLKYYKDNIHLSNSHSDKLL